MENNHKSIRKITKKQIRYKNMLLNETGIEHSDCSTQNLMICNAGLVSGIQYEDIVNIFSKFGLVERVLMVPGKSYCFVIFCDKQNAENAYLELNGNLKLDKMDGPMYLIFCQSVPQPKQLKNQHLPEGLTLIKNFVTEAEEDTLLKCVRWEEMNDNLGKIMKHRKVKHYGYEFRYDNNNVYKDKPLSEKIPQECSFISTRLEEKGYGSLPWTPDQLTVNQYQRGQGIPSHIDTHSAFESPIMSLSLGSDVVMEFKHADNHVPVLLPRRSMLIMDGPARYSWSHGITPRTMDVVSVKDGLTVQERGVRTSFTFRCIRQTTCNCGYHEFCDSWQPDKVSEVIAAKLEATHVHKVYDTIALHFSDTRSKVWPNVRTFVESFVPGSILLDVGCGNGKYFGVNKDIFHIGCDHSKSLASVTHERGHEVFTCNCLHLPVRTNVADGVISIAVLHHLSTEERRLKALQEIVRVLRIRGKALIYVWAKNQNKLKMSSYLKQDRKNRKKAVNELTQTNYTSNSCSDDVSTSGVTLVNNNTELPVNLPVHTNRTEFQHQDLLVPWKLKPSFCKTSKPDEEQMFLRYYHVFEEGEIDKVCKGLANVTINRTFYDEGNWCIVLEKIN